MYNPAERITAKGRKVSEDSNLQIGEMLYFCPECDFIGPKNAVMVPWCPTCSTGLRFISRKDEVCRNI